MIELTEQEAADICNALNVLVGVAQLPSTPERVTALLRRIGPGGVNLLTPTLDQCREHMVVNPHPLEHVAPFGPAEPKERTDWDVAVHAFEMPIPRDQETRE